MKIFPKYGSVNNLYKCKNILDHKVVVTEKLHGTNVRFMWDEESGLVLGGRNLVLFKDGQQNEQDGYSFTHFMFNISSIDLEELKKYEGYVFYGEYHGAGIQKGITYMSDRVKDLRIFDIRNPEGDFIPWDDAALICLDIQVRIVPTICEGIFTMEELEKLLNQPSQTALLNGVEAEENFSEGVVIKPVTPQRDRYGEWMRAKLKGAKWTEQAHKPKVPRPVNPEVVRLNQEAYPIWEQRFAWSGKLTLYLTTVEVK